MGDGGEFGRLRTAVAGHGQQLGRVDGLDEGVAAGLADGDVAGQQQPDLGVGRQGLVGEARVAGAEDGVVLDVLAEFGLEGGADVDGGQDAEALGGQRRGDDVDRLGLGEVEGDGVCGDSGLLGSVGFSGEGEEELLHLGAVELTLLAGGDALHEAGGDDGEPGLVEGS